MFNNTTITPQRSATSSPTSRGRRRRRTRAASAWAGSARSPRAWWRSSACWSSWCWRRCGSPRSTGRSRRMSDIDGHGDLPGGGADEVPAPHRVIGTPPPAEARTLLGRRPATTTLRRASCLPTRRIWPGRRAPSGWPRPASSFPCWPESASSPPTSACPCARWTRCCGRISHWDHHVGGIPRAGIRRHHLGAEPDARRGAHRGAQADGLGPGGPGSVRRDLRGRRGSKPVRQAAAAAPHPDRGHAAARRGARRAAPRHGPAAGHQPAAHRVAQGDPAAPGCVEHADPGQPISARPAGWSR